MTMLIYKRQSKLKLLTEPKMSITKLKPFYDQSGKLKGYIDKYTEEEYGFPVIVGRKRNPYGKGWIMNSQEALEILAKDKEIKGESYRVLLFICARLDFENWIQISQVEIANELKMHRQQVSKAMKILEAKEIILRGPEVGRSYAFRLNPYFGWKGKVIHLEKYREEDWKKEETKSKENFAINAEIERFSKQFNLPIDELKKLIDSSQSG
jgi:hypothetical protein